MKRVKIKSTKKNGIHETNATTWGELKKELLDKEFISDNMNVIGMDKKVYVAESTSLPEEDFTLIAVLRKVKSGAMSYNELRREVKHLVDNDPEAKAYFNQGGKNYTNKKRDELERLLGEWINKNAQPLYIGETEAVLEKEWTLKDDLESFAEQLPDDMTRKDLVGYTTGFLLQHCDVEMHAQVKEIVSRYPEEYADLASPLTTDGGSEELTFTKEEEDLFDEFQDLDF